MIAINVIEVFNVLGKENNEICVLSNGLSGQAKVILSDVNDIAIIVSSTRVIRFCFVLGSQETVVEYHQIFIRFV